jgi:DNA-binding HxlR family transcriptional regulator
LHEARKNVLLPCRGSTGLHRGEVEALIPWALGGEVMRFGELRKALPGVNTRMLTKQLRELEGDGIIRWKIYPEVPPRVGYAITEFGET